MKRLYGFFIILIILFLPLLFSAEGKQEINFKNYAIDLSNYHNQLSQNEINFINDKYNLILVNDFNKNLIEKNQILTFNILFQKENENFTEDFYAHSVKSPIKNKRINDKHNNEKYLMNIFSQDYQNFILNKLFEKIKDKNYYGILFKDIDFNLNNWIDYPPDNYNKDKFSNQILLLLNKIKNSIKTKHIIISGVYENISSPDAIMLFNKLNYGGITNKFIYSIFKIFNTSNEKIYVKFLNLVHNYSKSNIYIAYNKLTGLYSKSLSVEERLYSFTSYLFIYNPNIFYLIEDSSLNTPLQYYPEMDIDLGNPVDNYSDITFYYDKYLQIYKRKFEKGIVMVNPFPFSKIITLNKYFNFLKFSGFYINGKEKSINIESIKAKQIIIPAYSGVILLNAD